MNDYQESFKLVKKTLEIYPEFSEAKELLNNLEEIISVM